jgi:DnaJ-class molecular chaperone
VLFLYGICLPCKRELEKDRKSFRRSMRKAMKFNFEGVENMKRFNITLRDGFAKVNGNAIHLKGNRKVEVDGVTIVFDKDIINIETMNLCFRCRGKGGYEQLTGFSEDDTSWDLCEECNGSGIETIKKYDY